MKTYCSILLLSVLFIGACRRPRELVYRNVDHFQLVQAGLKETHLSANVLMYNPNRFSLKLKSADVSVFLNDRHLGKLIIDSLFTIPRLDSFALPVSLKVDMASLVPGALQMLFNKDVHIKLSGSIKAGKRGVYISVPVNYETNQDVMSLMQ